MAIPLGKPSDKADRPESPVPSGSGKMRRLRRCAPRLRSAPRTRSRAAWCGPGRRRLRSITWSGACAAAPASGPWANGSQPRYDLRRAPCIHPHFASNAIYGGLNRRFLNIRLAGTLTREQKRKIAEEVTDTLERIANKPKTYTHITFDELREENWAVAGKLLDE